MTLQRLALDFRTGGLVVHCLYHTEGEAGPNTKARRREVMEISRKGLGAALEALEEHVDASGRRDLPQGRMSFWPRPHRYQRNQ